MNISLLNDLARQILNGKVVLLPTDTVYGLAASPMQEEAVNRIYALKQRDKSFNLPIMLPSVEAFDKLGLDVNGYTQRLIASPYIPGPLTLVLGFKTGPVPEWLTGREEVAVRIPKSNQLIALLEQTGPLLVTSANRHKASMPGNIPEILEQLTGKPDVIIDRGTLESTASTIVNCRHSPPSIEREGCILKKELLEWIQ